MPLTREVTSFCFWRDARLSSNSFSAAAFSAAALAAVSTFVFASAAAFAVASAAAFGMPQRVSYTDI
jgi:hypothetical protein